MAGKSAVLVIRILADAAKAEQTLKSNLPKSVQGVEQAMGKLALPAGAALVAVAAFGKGTIDAAGEAEQAAGAIDAVFKDQSATVKGWAADSADAVGLSSTSYQQMATILGAQLKNMGTDMSKLAPQTNDLIALGADLAAQYGGDTSQAVEALSSLLRGERDPIERYGVSINQAAIDAQKAKMGLKGLTGEADKNATMQATLALLTAQTADAQGAFARETDTAAHAQQVANAKWNDAQVALGTALLPAVTAVTGVLTGLAEWVGRNADLVRTLGIVVGIAAAAILAINVAFKIYNTIATIWAARTQIMAAAQWLLNAALAANPIGIVIIAIVALVAAIVLLWQRSETFRRIVTQVFQAVLSVIQRVIATVVGIFQRLAPILLLPIRIWYGLAVLAFRAVATIVQWLVNTIIRPIWNTLSALLAGPVKAFQAVVGAVFNAVGAIIRTAIGALRSIWSTLTALLVGPFTAFQAAVTRVIGVVSGLFRGLRDLVSAVFKAIKTVVDKIARAIDSLPKLPEIKLPFGLAAPAPGGGAAAAMGRGRRLTPTALPGGGGLGLVININGALAPESTARTMARVLAQHRVRVGRAGPLATSAPAV